MHSNPERKEKEVRNPYLYVCIGAIGMLLLTFGIFELLELISIKTAPAFILIVSGLIILVHYIYHLEKKAGISNKLIWIRAIALIAIFAGAVYIAY
ncbi:MAG: hypothetical protein ACQEV0_01930 [Bacillota bacterium]